MSYNTFPNIHSDYTRRSSIEMITIRGQTLNIDIESELREFEWTRSRWTSDKLLAASPFRYDGHPSFFVNLTGEYAGTWADLGAYDAEWASGNFVKLLAFLRQETYEETEEYLLEMYGVPVSKEKIFLRLPPIKSPEAVGPSNAELVATESRKEREDRGIGRGTREMSGTGSGRQGGCRGRPGRLPEG